MLNLPFSFLISKVGIQISPLLGSQVPGTQHEPTNVGALPVLSLHPPTPSGKTTVPREVLF